MNIKKNKIQKKDVKKLFLFLGTHIFYVILILFLADLAIGGVLVLKYGILVELKKAGALPQSLEFDENEYGRVLSEIQSRKAVFDSIKEDSLINPFKAKAGTAKPQLQ